MEWDDGGILICNLSPCNVHNRSKGKFLMIEFGTHRKLVGFIAKIVLSLSLSLIWEFFLGNHFSRPNVFFEVRGFECCQYLKKAFAPISEAFYFPVNDGWGKSGFNSLEGWRLLIVSWQIIFFGVFTVVNKKASNTQSFAGFKVPVRGLEPPRGCPQWILNPSRLPIPPHRLVQLAGCKL